MTLTEAEIKQRCERAGMSKLTTRRVLAAVAGFNSDKIRLTAADHLIAAYVEDEP